MLGIHSLVARTMLALMLVTLLLPGLAWQATATHGEIAHASGLYADAGHHHGDEDSTGTDDAAHSAIGHVLGHLPIVLATVWALPRLEMVALGFADPPAHLLRISLEAPHRPPRFS